MVTRALGAIMAVGMLSASAASAGSLTDALQSDRMTVVKVDKATGGVLLRNGVSVNWLQAPGAMIVAPPSANGTPKQLSSASPWGL